MDIHYHTSGDSTGGFGGLKEKYYTLNWQRKGSGEHREHGVGFVVRDSLRSMTEPGSNGSELPRASAGGDRLIVLTTFGVAD